MRSSARGGRRRTLDVVLSDGTGRIELKWFRVPGKGFSDRFQKGVRVRASGAVTQYRGKKQIVHPEISMVGEDSDVVDQPADGLIPSYLELEGIRPEQENGRPEPNQHFALTTHRRSEFKNATELPDRPATIAAIDERIDKSANSISMALFKGFLF